MTAGRRIAAPALGTPSEADWAAVDRFLRAHSPTQLTFEQVGDERVLHVTAYSLKALDELLGSLQDPELAVLFKELQSAGPFGLKGGLKVLVGYADERKVAGRKAKEKARQPYYYATTAQEPGKPRAELPAELLDTIVTGDSLQVLKSLPDNCVDLVFTSPPYNFGLEYHADEQDDAAHWQNYFQRLYEVLDECVRVLVHGGRIIVNVQPLFSDYIPSHHLISAHLMSRGLIWKGEVLWEKNNYNCKYTAWGSFKSPSSPYLKYTWEFLEIFCKGSLKKPGSSQDADIDVEEFKSWVVAKWSLAPERRMKEFGHPAMFPESLAERALKLFSFRGDIVLDPFNGAGTTTAVAAKNGRHFLGIDVSEQYNDVARKRLPTHLQESLFLAGDDD